MNNQLKLFLRIYLCCTFLFGSSQQNKDELLKSYLQQENSLEIRFNNGHDLVKKYYLKTKLDSAYIIASQLYKLAEKTSLKADALLLMGLVEYSLDNNKDAIEYYKKSLRAFKDNNDIKGELDVLNNIGLVFNNEFRFNESVNYLKRAYKLSEKTLDTLSQIEILGNLGFVFNNSFKIDSAIIYLNKALKLSRKFTQPTEFILNELGNNYAKRKNYKKAFEFYNKSLLECTKNQNTNRETAVLFDMSTQLIFQKQFDEAIKYAELSLQKANQIKDEKYIRGSLLNLYEANRELGRDDWALYYLEESNSHDRISQQVILNRNLQDFEIKQIKLKDSLQNVANILKADLLHQKEKTKLTLFWGGLLTTLTLVGFLIYKNIKRKQRKAELERQKEIDEKEKILKDLELSTIDAMIKGQEKERQRLAADLHDSVGATLSAAKMQFNHIFKAEVDAKAREQLIKKTSTLLEDAYVEIRSMAHLKNSGVIAKNGLLPAVEKLSKNASGVNGLHFNVQSHGLDQRLDNTLEITIFRIIQELVTNIIKHANATKGTIHLTNHSNSLNIMVEDNGRGFNTKKTKTKDNGMGISSIDKRVEHLEGKLTIESQENKGTTVIIDIPL